MSGFEQSSEEHGNDKKWEEFVNELQYFLSREATTTEINDGVESESQDGNHPVARILEDIQDGDYESVSVYLDHEIEKNQFAKRAAQGDQRRLAYLDARQSDLEKFKAGLERK